MADPRADLLRAGYATVARAYREHLLDELAGKPLDRAMLDAFAEQVGQGLVIDGGCGPGHVARYLAERGVTVEGIDLSPAMIEEAIASHPGLTFRVGDLFALPYAAASVAGAVLFYAIVHVLPAHLDAPCRELARVIRPGGLALLAFHIGSESNHVSELFGCATDLDFQFHQPELVSAALVGAGFGIVARLDRAPIPGAEYPSQRCYLLARREP